MIGDKLERLGWRQGSTIQQVDNLEIFNNIGLNHTENLTLIIASQSCDIANNNIKADPYIEFSIARHINSLNGNFSYNKNPRILHANLKVHTEDPDITIDQPIEIKAFEKHCIPKEYFVSFSPSTENLLHALDLEGYISWLASRYSRPALPTEFNNRISSADPKDKLRKTAKGSNNSLSGIYIEITPDAEIHADQNYGVNLLGLVSAGFKGDLAKAEAALEEYAKVMRQAKMDVTVALRKESEVSIADIKRFKRFYYDDLSFKAQTPLPPEVKQTF